MGGLNTTNIKVTTTSMVSEMARSYGSNQPVRNCKLINKLNSQKNRKVKRKVYYLNCYYTNAQSLKTDKLLELRIIVAMKKPDLIIITETWFQEVSLATIEGYEIYRVDRVGTGGGVAIYVKKV
jgi:hypothetical protein